MVARNSLEVDLGIPVKNPIAQHEYSNSVRKNLSDIVKIADTQFGKSCSRA